METRQSAVSRLDENVILTMLITAVLATLIFAFRYKNRDVCMPFTVRTVAGTYHTGEVVRFETTAKGFKRLQWNFGDNQNNESQTATAFHAYDQPGNYTIEVSADRNCTEYKTLTITAAPKVIDPTLIPTFIAPQSAEVGKPVEFKDTTKGATQWEWHFGETATIDANSANPVYTFKTPGLKSVQLILNSNPQQSGVVKVFVNPAIIKASNNAKGGGGGGGRAIIVIKDQPNNPPLDQQNKSVEPLPPVQDITKAEMENELRLVADKQRTVQSFLPYFCGNPNVKGSVNGQETTFAEFCNQLAELKGAKKIKTLDFQMFKDERHCIFSFMVNFKKRENFFQKVF